MAERAWFAVECGMHKHEKMAGLPNDTARLGWYVVLAEAKLQKKQGQFASEAHFKAVIGRFARYLTNYVDAKLLDQVEGGLVVHDWQRHQWAAKKAGQREDNEGTSEGQKEDLQARTPAVPPVNVVSTAGEEGVSGETGADALDAWYRLTGSWPSPKVLPWLNRLIDNHTDAAVCEALGAEWMADPTRNTILGRVSDRLAKEAHESEKRRAAAKKKAAEDERRRIEEMPAEQRAANLERLRQAMEEKGLRLPRPETAA